MDLLTIVVSIITSLIASLVWFLLGTLYKSGSRKNIALLLERMFADTHQLEFAPDHQDYQVLIEQTDRLLDLNLQIYKELSPFTFGVPYTKRHKLFVTLLYNQQRVLEYAKWITVGYDEQEERRARCEKFRKRYNYALFEEKSCLIVNQRLLANINHSKKMSDIFSKLHYHGTSEDIKLLLSNSLIDVNSFKNKTQNKYHYMQKGLKQEEYLKIIQKANLKEHPHEQK